MSNDMPVVSPTDSGATRRKLLTGMGAAAAGGGLLALAGTQTASAAVSDGTYFSLRPERYVDTRKSGGKISGGQIRTLTEFEDADGLTFALNLTVVSTEGTSGYLSVYNADEARPTPYSSINWQGAGKVVANFNLVDGGAAGLKVYCSGGSTVKTHFIIDVIGVFLTNTAPAPAKVRAWQQKALQRRGR
jgi:hypothetical protein